MNRNIIVIAGPTAVGKTKYAIETALTFSGEIVSCDSMQLYKYMNIGSAKPTQEELSKVKHYLIDEIEPNSNFSVAQYQKLAKNAIENIFKNNKVPIVSGGTGLYLNSLLYDMDFSSTPMANDFRQILFDEAELFGNNYIYDKLKVIDPCAAQRIHPNNIKKVIRAIEVAENGNTLKDFSDCKKLTNDYNATLICLTRNRDELYDRINKRVDILIKKGLIKEVINLLERGLTEEDISMKGIGYKEIIGYLDGQYPLDDAIELVKRNTRHYAKRQLTWFKRYKNMKWFNISEFNSDEAAIKEIFQWLKQEQKK